MQEVRATASIARARLSNPQRLEHKELQADEPRLSLAQKVIGHKPPQAVLWLEHRDSRPDAQADTFLGSHEHCVISGLVHKMLTRLGRILFKVHGDSQMHHNVIEA